MFYVTNLPTRAKWPGPVRVLAAYLVTAVILVAGCEVPGPKDFNETLGLIDQARMIAEEQGVSWHATVSFNGRPNFYEQAALGFDSGLQASIHFQGNAQTEASESPKTSVRTNDLGTPAGDKAGEIEVSAGDNAGGG